MSTNLIFFRKFSFLYCCLSTNDFTPRQHGPDKPEYRILPNPPLEVFYLLVRPSRSCSLNLDFSTWPDRKTCVYYAQPEHKIQGQYGGVLVGLDAFLGGLERHTRSGVADATTHESIYLRLRIMNGLRDEQLSYVLCMKEIEFNADTTSLAMYMGAL
ncbi:uncharacterized protein CLUP02_08057 [Colletotrichum lupini]|uniref:Uncharacterized protein n=1 Tax=Colletotrichum lupini TaxID=145971 RepID=A0A9Q8WG99_9PEZI|nr:uncharacterized protein CLUP02_08057 [Colletotrichum lupini]UQC82568.1 hypothetical protein CLUP02_08057 [Colletotrichum lupini]